MTTTETLTQDLERNINGAILASGVTRQAVIDYLGTTRKTFEKRIKDGGLTVQQLIKVAEATRVPLHLILPALERRNE